MFKYNNSHIFTGYLKQLLSSINIPTCKIYTQEFARYFSEHGVEDPRIIESIDSVDSNRLAVRVNYIKDNSIYNYFWKYKEFSDNSKDLGHSSTAWRLASNIHYDSEQEVHGLTKHLISQGPQYDKTTHEYLGEYLRFLRDYHNINLMSLYNCFNNSVCNNINLEFNVGKKSVVFNSQDQRYRIYAIPVKLFENYTIAIDSHFGIEMFCGFYNTKLDVSDKAKNFINRTYQYVSRSIFKQPILYNKLGVEQWITEQPNGSKSLPYEYDLHYVDIIDSKGHSSKKREINTEIMTRWDIINKEQDLKLFIKVPVSSKSSIVILEGDFRTYNDVLFCGSSNSLEYKQNKSVVNFGNRMDLVPVDSNSGGFKPISKVQLLEFNTGESYPFSDRLVEYLTGSATTPIDEIHDNIERAQEVMKQNRYNFVISGLWENKMQKVLYDYIMNAGPVVLDSGLLIDKRTGYLTKLGHKSKSSMYDILGYVDRDAEKWYASWQKTTDNKVVIKNNIQNVDIYNKLYDIY